MVRRCGVWLGEASVGLYGCSLIVLLFVLVLLNLLLGCVCLFVYFDCITGFGCLLGVWMSLGCG